MFLVRPVVHVPVQKVNAMSGRRVQIECNIESYPRYPVNISRPVQLNRLFRADMSWEFTSERGVPSQPLESNKK